MIHGDSVIIEKIYASCDLDTKNCIEKLCEWFIDLFDYRLSYNNVAHTITPILEFAQQNRLNFELDQFYPVEVLSLTPVLNNSTSSKYFKFSECTELFLLSRSCRFVVVIDLSSSTLYPDSDGACYTSKVIKTLEILFHVLATENTFLLPGSSDKYTRFSVYVTVLAVVPCSECFTLISEWLVSRTNTREKLCQISRIFLQIEREFAGKFESVYLNDQLHGEKHTTSFSELLRHGALTASMLYPALAPATVVILTDGCFGTSDVENLDRIMLHLKAEKLRCGFIIIETEKSHFIPKNLFTKHSVNISVRPSIVTSNIQQFDLCNILAENTGGFFVDVSTLESALGFDMQNEQWNDLLNLFFAFPVITHFNNVKSNETNNLSFSPTFKCSSKIVELPMNGILSARLRSGFRIKHVFAYSYVDYSGNINSHFGGMADALASSEARKFETEGETSQFCLSTRRKVDLEMRWKSGIKFCCSIAGMWVRLIHFNNLNRPTSNFDVSSFTQINDDKENVFSCFHVIRLPKFLGGIHNCRVDFSIECHPYFIQELLCKQVLHQKSLELNPRWARFNIFIQDISLTDKYLKRFFEFGKDLSVVKVPEAFSSRLCPVFVLTHNVRGDLVAMPVLSTQQLSREPDKVSVFRFINFWRFFVDVDLFQCRNWMNLHHIFLVLEHDSPLPSTLHFPPSGRHYTAQIACRHALALLHTMLSQWSSFVLLESNTYVKLIDVNELSLEQFLQKFTSSSNSPHPTEIHINSSTEKSLDKETKCSIDGQSSRSGTSVSTVSYFCVLRLELKVPEVRLHLAFPNDIPINIQSEVIQDLEDQIICLRFPPRGRQAIPKSRHKSGAFQHPTEIIHVPPLQRSWEDTPCCTLFNARLDRLIVESGAFYKRNIKPDLVDDASKLILDKQSAYKLEHSVKSVRLKKLHGYHSNSFGHPNIDSRLIIQHLHHSVCVWSLPSLCTFKSCLQSLFSSILNIRLQEGFHLVRAGPQPGFISLITEVKVCFSDSEGSASPCLLQYQLYPVVDFETNNLEVYDCKYATPVTRALKNTITNLMNPSISQIESCPGSCDYELLNKNRTLCPVHLTSELWVQPIEGIIGSPPIEAEYWTGATFKNIASFIFHADENCIIPYVTLESLYGLLLRKLRQDIAFSPSFKVLNEEDPLLSEVANQITVKLAYSSLVDLIRLSPEVIVLFSPVGPIENKDRFSDPKSSEYLTNYYNESLLSDFYCRLKQSSFVIELDLHRDELTKFVNYLHERLQTKKNESSTSDFPAFRCFIGYGYLKHLSDPVNIEVNECNPMVSIIIVPATVKDASNPLVLNLVTEYASNTLIDTLTNLFVPVFIYTCSRLYLSYLIDDRWTYKPPGTWVIDMRYCNEDIKTQDIMQPYFHRCPSMIIESNSSSKDAPDKFLNAGCQNQGLTQELSILWSNLMRCLKFLSYVFKYSFSLTIYNISESCYCANDLDIKHVLLNCRRDFSMCPLPLDLTLFSMLNCSHISIPLRHSLLVGAHPFSTKGIKRPLEKLDMCRDSQLYFNDTNLFANEPLIIDLHLPTPQTDFICGKVQKECLFHIFSKYLVRLPSLDGFYLLSKSKLIERTGIPNKDVTISFNGAHFYDDVCDSQKNSDYLGSSTLFKSDTHSRTSSKEGDESETVLNARKSEFNNEAQTNRDAPSKCHSNDLLVQQLLRWLHSIYESASDPVNPIFLYIRAFLTYKGKSVVVSLTDNLPIFCANYFRDLLIRLIRANDFTSEDNGLEHRFKIDLSKLNFSIEILPFIHPECNFSSLFDLRLNDENMDALNSQPSLYENTNYSKETRKRKQALVELPFLDVLGSTSFYNKAKFYCFSQFTMAEMCIYIDEWLSQKYFSELSEIHRCMVRLFVFQFLWYVHDKVVCCLRYLTPVTEHSLELVLRHIEDTCKILLVPIFNNVPIRINRKENSGSNCNAEDSLIGSKQWCVLYPDLQTAVESVRMQRIRLDFISYSPEVFEKFVQCFENMLITHGYGRPCYVNGYYFLCPTNRTIEDDSERHRLFSDCEKFNKDDVHFGCICKKVFTSPNYANGNHEESHLTNPFTPSQLIPTFYVDSFPAMSSKCSLGSQIVDIHSKAQTSSTRRFSSTFPPNNHSKFRVKTSNLSAFDNLVYSFQTNQCRSCPTLTHLCVHEHHDSVETCVNSRRKSSSSDVIVRSITARNNGNSAISSDPTEIFHDEALPFWLVFRICSNSVSIFLHHTDTHNYPPEKYSMNHESVYTESFVSQVNLSPELSDHFTENLVISPPVNCSYCGIYRRALSSIHSVVRIINQQILLIKLRDERLCDDLLLSPEEVESLVSCEPSTSKQSAVHPPTASFPTEFASPVSGSTRSRQRRRLRYVSFLNTSDKLKNVHKGQILRNNLGSTSTVEKSRSRSINSKQIGFSTVALFSNQFKLLSSRDAWPPGVFACPVQMTSYLPLHPRVFLNTSQMYPVDKGRRVIPALRHLLENLTITNRSNMFFLIDPSQKPDTSHCLSKKKRCNFNEFGLSSPPTYCPVFYMLLKEITVSSSISEYHPDVKEKQPNGELKLKKKKVTKHKAQGDKMKYALSDVSTSTYFTSSEQTLKTSYQLGELKAVNYPSKYTSDEFLKITLHGVNTPSRHLCASVHHMLQTRLDSLVLQQISDSLSRNAINRLSIDDLTFLLNRRPEQPQCHYYVFLPNLLTNNESNLFGISPYVAEELILPFCHYLRQNLGFFLTSVKLDRDVKIGLKGLEEAELYLFNRPSAQGFAKHGVATLLLQILTISETSSVGPYSIRSWCLPAEITSMNQPNGQLQIEGLFQVLTDYFVVDADSFYAEQNRVQPLPRVFLSIRMWERGHADLCNLKSRVLASVQHSIFDLLTEYFILTMPISTYCYDQNTSAQNFLRKERFVDDNSVNSENMRKFRKTSNPCLFPLLLSWFENGRSIDSPLVNETSVDVLSALSVEQLITDLLKPFNSIIEFSMLDNSSTVVAVDNQILIRSSVVGCDTTDSSISTPKNCSFVTSQHRLHVEDLDEVKNVKVMDSIKDLPRPGFTRDVVIVGHNSNIWRKSVESSQKFKLTSINDINNANTFSEQQSAHNEKSRYDRNELISGSVTGVDLLLKMQPLKIPVLVTQCLFTSVNNYVNVNSEKFDLYNLNCQNHRYNVHSDELVGEPNFLSPGENKIRNVPPVEVQTTSDKIKPVSKFPGFCPVELYSCINRQPHLLKSSINGKSPILTQNDRSNSNECLNQTSLLSQMQHKTNWINVYVPRQIFCLIHINGRHIKLVTYNWTKEESERFSNRLISLVEWHNNRHTLLLCLSAQKMGLFHTIDKPFNRWCASRALELIRNICPPELNLSPDCGASNILNSVSNNLQNFSPNPPTCPTNYNIPSSVASGSVSVTRRRHATSSCEHIANNPYMNTIHLNLSALHSTNSNTSVHGFNPALKADLNENKVITNFLRLYQDCGCIPSLSLPSNLEAPYSDLLTRHGLQALKIIDMDRRQAQSIELFTIPFRAWQESSKHNLIMEETEKSNKSSTHSNKDIGHKPFTKSSDGSSSNESYLSNYQSGGNRFKYCSSIKKACRLLHTICTPILFCPNVRKKTVQFVNSEDQALIRTASKYFMENQNMNKDISESAVVSKCTNEIPTSSDKNDIPSGNTIINSDEKALSQSKSTSTNTGNRFLSPWLSWSQNSAAPRVDESTVPSVNSALYDYYFYSSNNTDIQPSLTSESWLRRAANSFLLKYAQYLQQEVGFHLVSISPPGSQSSKHDHNTNYALLYRSIHSAGLHLIELFIRKSYIYVRLGTLELSRFSWHASRSITTGPYAAAVISRAAASAAASMCSAMRNAVSGSLNKPNSKSTIDANISLLSSPRDRKYLDWLQYSNSLSWDQSNRLCDYTHMHSFAYDFYLHAIQDYLATQNRTANQIHGVEFNNRLVHGNKANHTNVITVPNYPVTEFLADLLYLAKQPPLFSRSYLCSFPVSCPVSLCLRPDQVLSHLIEEHNNYGVDVVRMSRVEDTPNNNQSLTTYNYAIVKQHCPESDTLSKSRSHTQSRYATTTTNTSSSSSSNNNNSIDNNQLRSLSEPQSCSNNYRRFHNPLLLFSESLEEYLKNKNLEKTDEEFIALKSISSTYCLTNILIPDESKGTYSDIRSCKDGPLTGRFLHLIVYVLLTDIKHEFPESRLAKLQINPYIQFKHPVEWPAVRPCLDLCLLSSHQTAHRRLTRSHSIIESDTQTISNPACRTNRNRNISMNLDMEYKKSPSIENLCDDISRDLRWHVSYLSMCPSNQTRLHHAVQVILSNLETSVTQLISQSDVDCHKNLLWYKLFDTNFHLISGQSSDTTLITSSLSSIQTSSNQPTGDLDNILLTCSNSRSNLTNYSTCSILSHKNLSIQEIEELVESAPFQLDILRLDSRLIDLFKLGAPCLKQVGVLLNQEFMNLHQNQQSNNQAHLDCQSRINMITTSTKKIPCVAYQFCHCTDMSGESNKHHLVLLSPSFTDGLILVSWTESNIVTVDHALNLEDMYKDFQFQAVFRAGGDPTNPNYMRELIDSNVRIQNLFFEASSLASIATNFVEKLSYLVWRTVHS